MNTAFLSPCFRCCSSVAMFCVWVALRKNTVCWRRQKYIHVHPQTNQFFEAVAHSSLFYLPEFRLHHVACSYHQDIVLFLLFLFITYHVSLLFLLKFFVRCYLICHFLEFFRLCEWVISLSISTYRFFLLLEGLLFSTVSIFLIIFFFPSLNFFTWERFELKNCYTPSLNLECPYSSFLFKFTIYF